jgi:hypothetical protein
MCKGQGVPELEHQNTSTTNNNIFSDEQTLKCLLLLETKQNKNKMTRNKIKRKKLKIKVRKIKRKVTAPSSFIWVSNQSLPSFVL